VNNLKRKKRKKKIKREIATGCPIVRQYIEECPFCIVDKNFRKRLPECVNPFLLYSVSETRNWLMSCGDDHKECEYYIEMKKHVGDILLAKKFIKKFNVDGFIALRDKHVKWLMKRVFLKSEVYIRKLFAYFGWAVTHDKHVDAKYLLTNTWNGLHGSSDDEDEYSNEKMKQQIELVESKKRKNRKRKRKNKRKRK